MPKKYPIKPPKKTGNFLYDVTMLNNWYIDKKYWDLAQTQTVVIATPKVSNVGGDGAGNG